MFYLRKTWAPDRDNKKKNYQNGVYRTGETGKSLGQKITVGSKTMTSTKLVAGSTSPAIGLALVRA